MTSGFSLGDFIAVAQLAYQLSKALSESKGATEEYRTLIAELDVVHRVLLQDRSWIAILRIVAAQIASRLCFENKRTFRKVDFGNLPLASIPKLKAVADTERVEDMLKRLRQIRQLPLDRMTRYCRGIPGDRKSVQCLLCGQGSRVLKDYWATQHFRACHKEYYFGMFQSGMVGHFKAIPWGKQLKKLPPSASTEFSAVKWITVEDITLDVPIQPDSDFAHPDISQEYYLDSGPVMIQRFVVVREDNKYCLCLGIHTYAKQGCGNQSDQELHGVLSSGKTPPPLAPNETKVILSPVRMKPDHPSLALSNTARIHYGRAYEISHEIPVQPLGLVHPASMEVLLNQFEAHVTRVQPGEDLGDEWEEEMPEDIDPQQKVEDGTSDIKAAYTRMNIVKDMRRSMKKVLGPKLPLPSKMYHVRDACDEGNMWQ
ncbi:hypothetical protein CI102_8721 [Trichoderma harzianum]|nr:hypothetical protein CI102_8721 [Trichoderma harzianum]